MWDINMRNVNMWGKSRPKMFLPIVLVIFTLSVILAGCGKDDARQAGAASAVGLAKEQSFQAGMASALGLAEEQNFEDSKWQDVREIAEYFLAQAAEQAKEQEENAMEPEPVPVVVPKLPERGQKLSDFVPEGWELIDSTELDFNKDQITDYVGVLNVIWQEDGQYKYWACPRILFAVASGEDGQYLLSFQDENLIRNRNEGGVFGDPYLPLTAQNSSFTTHSYGGSAWRWSEDYTYDYKDGTWYLTKSEHTYGYGDYTTSYEADDWERGIGIRKERSSEFSDMEKHWDDWNIETGFDKVEYDIVYEVSLDEMQILYQAGKRWWLAPDRVTDWEVKSVTFAEDIADIAVEENAELSKKIEESVERGYNQYNDENCMLYTYYDQDSSKRYLVMYRWEDKALSVLAESESAIDDLIWYQGKIYYTTEIVENITYKTMRNGTETMVQEEDTVGLILYRMNEDGSGKESIFEYRYPAAAQEIIDKKPPYLAFIYEISGGEIILEVYIGSEPHPFYRMNIDGSEVRQIGQVPKE